MISSTIILLFKIIYLIIIVTVFLSWVPALDRRREPVFTLIKIYNVIMAPFKSLIPPIGMIDITPIIAIFVLRLIEHLLLKILFSFGL